jgi:hypothetical protein
MLAQNWLAEAFGLDAPSEVDRCVLPSSSTWVYAFIKALQQTSNRYVEGFADPKQSRHGDGPSCFNLLPVSRREAERDHVLLAETS